MPKPYVKTDKPRLKVYMGNLKMEV